MTATDSTDMHGEILVDLFAGGARNIDGRYQGILPGLWAWTAEFLPQKC
jgi:hypothetical protein